MEILLQMDFFSSQESIIVWNKNSLLHHVFAVISWSFNFMTYNITIEFRNIKQPSILYKVNCFSLFRLRSPKKKKRSIFSFYSFKKFRFLILLFILLSGSASSELSSFDLIWSRSARCIKIATNQNIITPNEI